MQEFVDVVEALAIGLYTTVGLHFYSIVVSRTRNQFLRFLIFLAAVVLFIGGGLMGLALIYGGIPYVLNRGPSLATSTVRYLTLMCWLGVILAYLFLNWHTLRERLKYPSNR